MFSLFKEKVKKTVIHLVCGYGEKKKKTQNMDMGVSAFRETLGVLKGTQRYQTFNSIMVTISYTFLISTFSSTK